METSNAAAYVTISLNNVAPTNITVCELLSTNSLEARVKSHGS